MEATLWSQLFYLSGTQSPNPDNEIKLCLLNPLVSCNFAKPEMGQIQQMI